LKQLLKDKAFLIFLVIYAVMSILVPGHTLRLLGENSGVTVANLNEVAPMLKITYMLNLLFIACSFALVLALFITKTEEHPTKRSKVYLIATIPGILLALTYLVILFQSLFN
jgi:glucan phosphoethanolaminetransferase (alkaline phosphatase superfamily)